MTEKQEEQWPGQQVPKTCVCRGTCRSVRFRFRFKTRERAKNLQVSLLSTRLTIFRCLGWRLLSDDVRQVTRASVLVRAPGSQALQRRPTSTQVSSEPSPRRTTPGAVSWQKSWT